MPLWSDIQPFVTAVVSLFAIIDPIGPIIIERLMMIFIAAIGVDFIYRGVLTLFPRLKG
jgi:small neutral amino acid transporter SnatA (MarC family)